MKETRKKYSPSQKAAITRELLESGHPVSKMSEKYGIHPSQLLRWKKELFEGAIKTFSRSIEKNEKMSEKEVDYLKSRLSHKDGIIAELLEENLQLKKKDGAY